MAAALELIVAGACVSFAICAGADAWAADASLDARKILESASRAGAPAPAGWTNRRAVVEIDSYAEGDLVRERSAEVYEKAGDDGELSTLTEFLSPADVQSTRVLEIWHPGKKSEAWMWSPSSRRARRMTDEHEDESPYYNVEPSYRIAQLIDVLPRLASKASALRIAGEEKLDGTDTTIVEITLSEKEALPGTRHRVWISNQTPSVRRIDVLDDAGEAKRRVVVRSVESIEGQPTAMELEVATLGTDRRTVYRRSGVRYGGLPDNVWSLANLSKGR